MAIMPVDLQRCLSADLASQNLPPTGGEFWPGMGLQEASAVSLYNAFLKKLRTGRTALTDDKALRKFLACNDACEGWDPDVSAWDTKTEVILGTVRQLLDDFWHPNGLPLADHPTDALERGALGPGVSLGSRANDFYSKLFASPLSVSDPSLYFWYRRYIWSFPEWSIAEQIRSAHYGEPNIVSSSRLSFVPKNDEISRCICIEPTLNVLYQLGFGRLLEDRLHGMFGISLQRQPQVNRALARLGSITDGLATLDLSSASDSISVKMLRWLLPASFFSQLMKYRSPSVDVKGRGQVALHMISTMGNGYTFPLQTVLFSAVVVACMTFRGIPWKHLRHLERENRFSRDERLRRYPARSDQLWSVFGDDIICPSATAADVVKTLGILGFTVNNDKSFVEGPFRESCGSDFFNGQNIRGVYVKTLNTPEARFAVINQLARFSTRTGIHLTRTLRLLLDSVEDMRVPPWEDFSSGIHVPESLAPRTRDKNGTRIYYARVPVPRYIRFEDSYVVVPRGCKRLIHNPSGLLVSLLQGSVKSCSTGVREDPVRYKTKRRKAPSWVPRDSSAYESTDYETDWGRWNTVLEALFER